LVLEGEHEQISCRGRYHCASCAYHRGEIVELNGTFCLCSRGWVKIVFETTLERPVRVKLEKAIGRGDDICKYNVHY